MNKGSVALVGAGPGEVGWITVRGLQLLRLAEVVVFDALANPRLLDEAPTGAERVDAGKRAKEHKLTQDETNQLMADRALAGKFVVRLKGGDPYLFGRGAEEVAFLARQGVACEVVPGITSGIAAPMTAGIPVTHREFASSVTFVTGHEDPTKGASSIDYASLAGLIRSGGTACFYMGVGRLSVIAQELERHGLSGGTPVAVVQWGSTPRQKSVRAVLTDADERVRAAGIGAPAIIVVGAVAGIDEPGLDFFTRRPLFGHRVLVTRTRQQASELRGRLEERGAAVIEAPTIEVVPASDATMAEIDAAIRDVKQFDWLVLTSAHGVTGLAERLRKMELDARHLAGVKIAAIGDATVEELAKSLGIRADLVPARFVGETLAEELIAKHGVKGKKVLLLRADIARPALPKMLGEAGAEVRELAIYETRRAVALPGEVIEALRKREIDWVTFTSSSTAKNLVALLGEERGLLDGVKLASIGPITSDAMAELGLSVTVEAEEATMEGLADAMGNEQSGKK